MGLLLLALAQLRFGSPDQAGRDHVVILETSAWMGARSGNRTLMDLARERARRYVPRLPSRDRVMLVRADALATPATAFEPGRAKIEEAIRQSEPGSTALNLDQALAFARHIQSQQGRRAGEIAFIGTGRTADSIPRRACAAQSARHPDSRRHRKLRPAQDRHAPLGHRSRPVGDLHFRAQLRTRSRRRSPISLNFGTQDPATRIPRRLGKSRPSRRAPIPRRRFNTAPRRPEFSASI